MDADFPRSTRGVGIFYCPLSAYQEIGNMSNQSYTVDEFCAAERISRSMLYKLWKEDQGPRFYYVGNVRRIPHEARLEWQRQMLAATGEAA